MGSNGEFGPDTDAIRAWLEKRKTYADDDFVARHRADAPPAPPATPSHAASSSTGETMPAPAAPIPTSPDHRDVGRSVIAAIAQPEAPRTEVAHHASGGLAARANPPQPSAASSAPTPNPSRWTEPERVTRTSVTDVEFKQRGLARKVASAILLACLAATGYAIYLAISDRTQTNIALAVAFGVVTLIVWAARTGMTTVQLAIHRGHLEVRRGGTVEKIDLGNPYTPVAVLGEPTDRGWCVLIERFDKPLFVVSPSLVEPDRFIEVLYRMRPDVANGPKFRPR